MNKYGVRWMEFNKKDQAVTKEKFFKTETARERFVRKLQEKDNFWQILAYCNGLLLQDQN